MVKGAHVLTRLPIPGVANFGAGAAAVVLAMSFAPATAWAQKAERVGKEVVESVCIACHGPGANGAPKIGDNNAWAKRAEQGLSGLTQHALDGIRQMPPHGGNPNLSNTEIARAITYMVNQSGGHWTEPINRASSGAERNGEQIVHAQCAKCHETGVEGAPKVGDRAAWIPRLKQGLDPLVRSAINGHGGMPPRGGMANLTDAELRSAIVYMVNAGTVAAKASTVTSAAASESFKVIEGVTIYFGVISADAIRRDPKTYPKSVFGAAPSVPDQYYVTVSLFDAANGRRIADAAVKARVSTATRAGPEKTLDPADVPSSLTYGNYFAMAGAGTYEVTLLIKRPGMANAIQARFDYTH